MYCTYAGIGIAPVRKLTHADSPVAAADAHRNQALGSVNLLETQTRMAGIVEEPAVGRTSLSPNIGRQRGQQLPKARCDV